MKLPPLRLLLATGAALAFTVVPRAAEPAIIAKARAYVGPEAALNGVKSIHFVGTLVTSSSIDPKSAERAAVEIYFQAPEQQRIQATSSKSIEVTALDGYDAWQRQQDATDSTKWQVKLLSADQIKRLRANTWETLDFYRGIERHGGRIEDQGSTTMDGVGCEKLAFIYAPNIIFYRFIDATSGHLVSTETESGTTIHEQGELMAGGIRFPKTIVTVTKSNTGQTQTITLTFEKITVNEAFPAKQFAVPALAR
jgi:outer membrane lipoprotein-sorting protein